MFIKTLEITNFKSISHKIRFDFSSGTSIVIDRNDDSCSDIVQAIRWVLGAQSLSEIDVNSRHKILYKRFDDLFLKCDVLIVFDNSDRKLSLDSDEVRVKRSSYYEDGDEYYINGKRVRLVDVRNLMSGTGLGLIPYSILRSDRVFDNTSSFQFAIEDASGLLMIISVLDKAKHQYSEIDNNLKEGSIINEEYKKVFRTIKRRLKNGPDNCLYREEYYECCQMLGFYKAVSYDINNTKQEINDVYKVMQSLYQKKREDVLAHLSTVFGETCRDLFGWSGCGLLEDHKDQIKGEATVSICVEGKKVEKHFSRSMLYKIQIALVFTFCKTGMIGSCILDGADTILDNDEWEKMITAISKLKDQNQFIVLPKRCTADIGSDATWVLGTEYGQVVAERRTE